MDVDRTIALITAAGIELTDRRREDKGNGWSRSCANGASVEVGDDGSASATGKGAETVARLLNLPAAGGSS